jgi:ubiquitin carboxyl-terminal hydrolase 10
MSETLHGDFNSPRGATTAAKQVFIETLPPVLILHLKRFHYEGENGTQKIWKKVGYPLELTVPKELFAPHLRNVGLTGMRYRLNSVVYHHGKNASGGHYTADVRRQDGREWIRIDDTVIRRLRSEDVAEGGAGGEEDDDALPLKKKPVKRSASGKNQFESIDQDDSAQDADDEGGWSQVNGSGAKDGSASKKKANGASSPAAASSGQSKAARGDCGRESKVAYILFYRRIAL